jgi:beta-glucosidase
MVSHEENIKLIKEAVELAKSADVIVLMLGGNDKISREATTPVNAGDLANLELLGDQNELIDSLKVLNKPTAAFVFSGPPISFAHLKKSIPAIVQCWYLGQETGYAVAETLFGDNNPTGKLTISIPRSAGHIPAYYFMKPSARIRPYSLDSITPLYPFGFGLSYTKYAYSNLRIANSTMASNENVTVTIDVKNIGQRGGEEIVQLYIRDEVSSVTRPIRELKDFKRIALEPGETKQVSFTITPDKLSFFDINMKEVVEPGAFTIMVGPSSQKFDTVKLTVVK